MTDLADALMEDEAPELVGTIVIEVYDTGTLRVATDLSDDDTDAVLLSACIGDTGPQVH